MPNQESNDAPSKVAPTSELDVEGMPSSDDVSVDNSDLHKLVKNTSPSEPSDGMSNLVWLNKIVSSIRRMANLKRLTNRPYTDPWIASFDAFCKRNYATMVDEMIESFNHKSQLLYVLLHCGNGSLELLLDRVTRFWDYLKLNVSREPIGGASRHMSVEVTMPMCPVSPPARRCLVMDVVKGRFGSFAFPNGVFMNARKMALAGAPNHQQLSVQDPMATSNLIGGSQLVSASARAGPLKLQLRQPEVAPSTAPTSRYWKQQPQYHMSLQQEKVSQSEFEARPWAESVAVSPRNFDDQAFAVNVVAFDSNDQRTYFEEDQKQDANQTFASADFENDYINEQLEAQRKDMELELAGEEKLGEASDHHREEGQMMEPSLLKLTNPQRNLRRTDHGSESGFRDSYESVAFRQEECEHLEFATKENTVITKQPELSEIQSTAPEYLIQDKIKETSLLERFGLLSSDDEGIVDSDVSTSSLGAQQNKGSVVRDDAASAQEFVQEKQLDHRSTSSMTVGFSESLVSKQRKKAFDSVDRRRDSPQPIEAPTFIHSTGVKALHNSPFKEGVMSAIDIESTPVQFPVSSPVNSYGDEETEFKAKNVSEALLSSAGKNDRGPHKMGRDERKRKRREEKNIRKLARKKEKKRKKKATNDQGRTQDREAADISGLETPRKLDIEDFSLGGNKSGESGLKHVPHALCRQVTTGPDGIVSSNERCTHSVHSFSEKQSGIITSEAVEGTMTGVGDIETFTSPSSIPQQLLLSPFGMPPVAHTEYHVAPIRVVCSEFFLENFGDVVAELSANRVTENQRLTLSRPIHFIDSELVDLLGVHVETPNRGAIIVFETTHMMSEGLPSLLPKFVALCAAGRYQHLDVVISLDVNLDESTSQTIGRLQNATLRQGRHPFTNVAFRITSPAALPRCIAECILVLNTTSCISDNIETWLSGERAREHLRFLISLLPTLSLTGALNWLTLSVGPPDQLTEESYELISTRWFQGIFGDVDKSIEELESNFESESLLRGTMNPNVIQQLKLVARTLWK